MRLSRLNPYLRGLVIFGCFLSILGFLFFFFGVSYKTTTFRTTDETSETKTERYVDWRLIRFLAIVLAIIFPASLYLGSGAPSQTGHPLRSTISIVVLVSLSIAVFAFLIFLETQGVLSMLFPDRVFYLILAVVLSAPPAIWSAARLLRLHQTLFTIISIALIGIVLAALTAFYIVRPDILPSYIVFAGVFSTPLLTLFVLRHTKTALILYMVSLCASIVLWRVPLSSRPQFLRNLGRLKPGMTVAKVEEVMQGYMKGVGQKWERFTGKGDTLQETTNEDGELEYEGKIVFRHSDAAAFDSDWGIVTFKNGRVVDVKFAPD